MGADRWESAVIYLMHTFTYLFLSQCTRSMNANTNIVTRLQHRFSLIRIAIKQRFYIHSTPPSIYFIASSAPMLGLVRCSPIQETTAISNGTTKRIYTLRAHIFIHRRRREDMLSVVQHGDALSTRSAKPHFGVYVSGECVASLDYLFWDLLNKQVFSLINL